MKIISIAFRRTDLLLLQKAAWAKYVPGVEFVVAAHRDHLLEVEPDILLEYDPDPEWTLWPHNYLRGVEQVLEKIDDDVIVVEGDIFPIKQFDVESMFKPGTIRWYGRPYPGLLFMPKARKKYEELNTLDWKYVPRENDLIPFDITDVSHFELIGEHFLHWNHGDVAYRNNPERDPRKDLVGKFCAWFGIPYKEFEHRQAFLGKRGTDCGHPATITKEDKTARKQVCLNCEWLRADRHCTQIRRTIGCSACSEPWQIASIACPESKWPEIQITFKPLRPDKQCSLPHVPVGILTRNRAAYLDAMLDQMWESPFEYCLTIYDDASECRFTRRLLDTADHFKMKHEWPKYKEWSELGLDSLEDNPTLNGIAGKIDVVRIGAQSIGVTLASCRAICDLFDTHSNAPAVILLQDDIIVAKDWYSRLVGSFEPDRKQGIIAGMHLDYAGVNGYYSAQCYLITREFFEAQRKWFEYRHPNRRSFDVQICAKARESGFGIELVSPQICQHIGVESQAWPNRAFRAKGYLRIGNDEGMALKDDAVAIIEARCKGRVLELGTGNRRGTEAALKKAAEVVTVENMSCFVRSAQETYKNNPNVTVLHCELNGDTYELPEDIGTFDTIIVDGPQLPFGRSATLEKVIPLLKPSGLILVDDAKRDEEAIQHWAKHYELEVLSLDTDKGLAMLTKAQNNQNEFKSI